MVSCKRVMLAVMAGGVTIVAIVNPVGLITLVPTYVGLYAFNRSVLWGIDRWHERAIMKYMIAREIALSTDDDEDRFEQAWKISGIMMFGLIYKRFTKKNKRMPGEVFLTLGGAEWEWAYAMCANDYMSVKQGELDTLPFPEILDTSFKDEYMKIVAQIEVNRDIPIAKLIEIRHKEELKQKRMEIPLFPPIMGHRETRHYTIQVREGIKEAINATRPESYDDVSSVIAGFCL